MNIQHSRYYTFVKPVLKNPYTKTYTTFIFNLIFIIIFSVFAIRPTVLTILSLRDQISQQQKLLDQLNQKKDQVDLAIRNFNNIPDDTKQKLYNLIPSETHITQISDNLAGLTAVNQASFSGIQFQSTDLVRKPDQLSKTSSLSNIQFTFTTQGDYPNLVSILSSLVNTSRLLSVDSISMQGSDKAGVTVVINGQAYLLKNE